MFIDVCRQPVSNKSVAELKLPTKFEAHVAAEASIPAKAVLNDVPTDKADVSNAVVAAIAV
jgi:hypothetical protein